MKRMAWVLVCGSALVAQAPSAHADLGPLGSAQRQQYEAAYAKGQYQELSDAIETKASGWFAQEYFFAGAANFGLAVRAGAAGLRCVYAQHARELLESFLIEADQGYQTTSHFGTSEDLNCVRTGVKMLSALKAFHGCEEPGYSEARLERFAIRYGRQRIRDVFFGMAEGNAATRIRAILDTEVFGRIQSLVDKAARIETRYGMISVEIDAARDRMGNLAAATNAFASLVSPGSASASVEHLVEFDAMTDKVQVKEDVVSRAAASVAVGRRAAWEAISAIRSDVLRRVDASDPLAYVDKKKMTLGAFGEVNTHLLTQAVVWTELGSDHRDGMKKFRQSLTTPGPATLADIIANIDTTWRENFRDECVADASLWFCAKAK